MLEDDSTLDSQLLFDLSLFQGLDISTAREYLDHAEHHILPKGEILLSPRSGNNDLYVVLSGLLSVHLESPNSDMIATINIGECAGEMSLFDEGTPSAYVVAADDARILKMSGEMVWDIHSSIVQWLLMLRRADLIRLRMPCWKWRRSHLQLKKMASGQWMNVYHGMWHHLKEPIWIRRHWNLLESTLNILFESRLLYQRRKRFRIYLKWYVKE